LTGAKVSNDMFNMAFEDYIGDEENINEVFVSNFLETFNFTPFKSMTDPYNLPNLDIDTILEEVTISMEKDALDLQFGDVLTFMCMVDLASVDLAILNQKFNSETDVRIAQINDKKRDSNRRKLRHEALANLINSIPDPEDD